MQGWVSETTFDEDYENYSQLSQYNKDKIGLIQLQYGELSELLKKHRANTYTVDVSSEPHKLVFKYIEPETDIETEMPETLEEKVERLEKENEEIKLNNNIAIVDLIEKTENDKLELSLALVELTEQINLSK